MARAVVASLPLCNDRAVGSDTAAVLPFKALAFATGCPAGKYTAAVAARCLPRYALLAWLGAAVQVPVWIMVALFALLMIPSLRMVWWRRAAS